MRNNVTPEKCENEETIFWLKIYKNKPLFVGKKFST